MIWAANELEEAFLMKEDAESVTTSVLIFLIPGMNVLYKLHARQKKRVFVVMNMKHLGARRYMHVQKSDKRSKLERIKTKWTQNDNTTITANAATDMPSV